jgi:lysophospholipase L1-like esterase
MLDFLKNKGEIRVCYLGGSITEGAGASDKSRRWATQITAHLNSFGVENAVFREINAGIGGTDSAYGILRLERDVISCAPHIVFIDFSLNDAGLDDDFSTRMYEGIIRKLMALEEPPYVVCIGVVPNREQEAKNALHRSIAEHYGLAYIDVKAAMEAAYGKGDPGVNTARDALFRPDNVHPVEAGYDFYTEVIKKELTAESFRKPCGAPISADFEASRGVFTDAGCFGRKGEWRVCGEKSWSEPNPGRKGTSLASADADAELSFSFAGKTLLLGARLDRNAGKAQLCLDGESEICDLRYATDDQPVIILSRFDMSEAEHTLTIRPYEGEIKVDFALTAE